MTNKEVISALKEVKTYCAVALLDPLDYALHVFEHLERAGVQDAVHADFSLLVPGSRGEER